MGRSDPNYFKIFSILSFILIVLFAIVLFFMQTHSMKRMLLNIAENRAMILSQQLAQIISEEFLKPHLLSHDKVNLNNPDTLRKLDKLIQFHFKNQNIVRVVLYDKDSMITYSTLHTIIGSDSSENADVRGALDGQISSKVVDNVEFDDFDPGSAGLHGRIIETYVPLLFKFMEEPLKGVAEMYQDLTEIEAKINVLNQHFLFTVVIVSAFLYILLLLATTQIEKKRIHLIKQLADKNTDLERSEKELGKYANEMESLAEERSKQLVHADRMVNIGILAAGVAHEINNPNSFIISNLQIFEMLWDRTLKNYLEKAKEGDRDKNLSFAIEEIPRMVKTMSEGAKRISTIVRSLSDFSRVKEVTFEQASICECIKNAVTFCRFNPAMKYKVDVQLNLPEDMPNIMMSRQEIEQVLINLLTNAIHAMEKTKDDRKPTLNISATHTNDEVVIEITDNGCGMDEKTLGSIFNPFFTTKEAGKGTGLGLSICNGIVERHGGTITARSESGKGATFQITLPEKQKEHK